MISMTGFAYREKAEEDISVSVEIKGYNNRYLEVYINSPPWFSVFESEIRRLVSEICGRGKVEVFIRIKERHAPLNVGVNIEAAKAWKEAITKLASGLGVKEKPGLQLLLSMEGVIETEGGHDAAKQWQITEPLFHEALEAFKVEREREGEHTAQNILGELSRLEKLLEVIVANADTLENTVKENIRTRFAEVLGDKVDENRVLAETAALLVKYTIAEEISRLSSHLGEFRAETERNPRPGKKLDFLCQEINREINTIGSKSNIIEAGRAVVEMKEALENIREQLRNVE